MLALLFGGHPDDFDLVADAERRDGALGEAPGQKRKAQPILEIIIPAQRREAGVID